MAKKRKGKGRGARRRDGSRAARPGRKPGNAALGDRLRPWLLGAMIALFVARPLFPGESAANEGDGLPVVMLWIALAVFWLLGAIGRREFRLRLDWTDAAVLALVAWHTIAAVWAATQLSPRPAVNMLWEWIGLALAFLLARQLIVTAREARAAVAVMIALAAAVSVYGLYQYGYEMPQARAAYAADPDAALRGAGMWFPPGSPERMLFEDRLDSTEPLATFALTNSLAGFLVPWLVVGVGIAVGGRQGRWPIAACLLSVAACFLLTKSRSGYAAAALGLLLAWLACRRRSWSFGWKAPAGVGLAVAALLAMGIAVGGLDRQVFSEASKSLGYRAQYWQSTMRMIGERPLLGCGPGNFQYEYTRFKLPEASEEVADPHNFLLEVWATAGTPAMLALVAVLGCFAWGMWRGGDRVQGSGFRVQDSGGSDSLVNSRRLTAGDGAPPTAPSTQVFPWPVYAGAACGFVLAAPLGLLSAAPPGLAVQVIGLPVAAGCLALLAGWVDRGELPPALPLIGVIVLLVNLLAAGGIGIASVAGSLWLLIALGLNRADGRDRSVPRSATVGGLAVAVTLLVCCYVSGYGPVLRSLGFMRLAWSEPASAQRHLAHAAVADPRSARPWQQLAALKLRAWQNAPSDEEFRRFETCITSALELVPNSSRSWLAAGDAYRQAFDASGRPQHIAKAIAAYRRAVQQYPNNGPYRAQLALAHKAAGEDDAFRREADEALRLDRLTPHADQKLPESLRRQLLPESEDS